MHTTPLYTPNDQTSFANAYRNTYPATFSAATYNSSYNTVYDSTYQPSYNLNNYSANHHNTTNGHVGHVYTTESYPPAFLPPSSNSSTDSSPIESPTLLPRRMPSSAGVNDQFMLDQNRDYIFTVPSNSTLKVNRRSSRASLRGNRNSILLDPIVEEENSSMSFAAASTQ
ncbi:14646_t:CDS:1 [Cetraspora pellucida]|uniref:14646_t:CDS:1 n=1 Tax=Cetraspora pellucida TaxID=1433469 RepID=A0ACA9NL75_9GLOM|nr:14646_t:CDS:1 [Cetraspora pellucida]